MSSSKKRRRSESYSSDEEDSSDDSDSSSDESSEDQRRSSKHRRDSRDSSRSERKKKKKKNKKHSKKKKKKEKKKRRKSADVEQISSLDYFKRSKEFRVWLKEERRIFFDELSSEQSREKFRSFVKRWNRGELSEKYYKDIEGARMESIDRTRYKWNFSGQQDSIDSASIGDQVNSWTKKETIGPLPASGPDLPTGPTTSHEHRSHPVVGPMLPPAGLSRPDSGEEAERMRQQIFKAAQKKKQRRDHDKLVLDELLPKATGFQARVEKRQAAAEQRRARAESPEMTDSRLFGGSGGDIHKRLAQRRQSREHQREVKQQRALTKLDQYREKEQARMAELKAMAMANRSKGALWK